MPTETVIMPKETNSSTEWTPVDVETFIWDGIDLADIPFVPDHASSVICELHMEPGTNGGKVCITTKYDYTQYKNVTDEENIDVDVDFNLYSFISNAGTPMINTSIDTNSKFITKLHSTDYSVAQFELPLYRDKNSMKFFSFQANSLNASFVIRIIGYRA